MHKGIIIGLISVLFFSCKKNTQTVLVEDLSINTTDLLTSIKFVHDDAFICGGERFLKASIYKLNNQTQINSIDLSWNANQNGLYDIDGTVDGKLVAVGYNASMYTSNDTGKTWNYFQQNFDKVFQGVQILENDSLIIVGGISFGKGFIINAISNSIISESSIQDKNFEISDVDFVNAQIGYACGYGAILKTKDGGQTWNFTAAKNDYFKAMSWKNELEGIAVGYAGSICKTTDGGDSWQVIRNGNSITKKKIYFQECAFNGIDTYVAVAENGMVCMSTNNGSSWKEVKKFTTEDLWSVAFRNKNECIVVGSNGAVFRLKL